MNLNWIAAAACLATTLAAPAVLAADARWQVKSADELEWGYLNPLRGKASPGAADLWGDRTEDTATGMLVRFNKGFSSPPHIHNITYRGVVIEGLMHNDDPSAEVMWMPTGSFWTQPAGENHITAAQGEHNLIYLEIDAGPYLVQPADQRFDNGERPLNLHASNLVWLDETELSQLQGQGAEVAQLWGQHHQGEPSGSLVRLAPGYRAMLTSAAPELRMVVIQGELGYQSSEAEGGKTLAPGSYVASSGPSEHLLAAADSGVLIYLRTDDDYLLRAQ